MGEKKIKGRKRHIVTDTLGHLLHVKVHAANIHDTVSGQVVFHKACEKYPSIKGVCADAGYRKTTEKFVKKTMKKLIHISQRISQEWCLMAKRWVVERTFAWLNPYRRLAKDFETSTSSAENYVIISHAMLLVKRLGKTNP
jgi:transposase